MAKETITVEYKVDTKGAEASINKLEKSFDDLDNSIKDTQRTSKQASQERIKALEKEEKELQELRKQRKLAFNADELKEYNNKISESTKKINTLKDSVGKTNKVAGFFKSQLGQITTALAGAFAVERVIAFTSEVVKLAGKAEGVKKAFARLNQPNLLNDLRRATKGTISDLELMQRAVQAKNFKIPLETMGTLLEFARRRAKETGESVDFLVESIVTGIGRKSPLILDNLGISAVELREEFKKIGDFGQATANIVERELAGMGEDIDTTTEKLSRLTAGWENFKLGAGEAIIDVVDTMAEGGGMFDANETLLGQLGEISREYNINTDELYKLNTSQKVTGATTVQLTEKGQELLDLYQTSNEATESLAKSEETLNSIRKLGLVIIEDLVESYESQSNTIKGIKTQIKDLIETLEDSEIGSTEFLQTQQKIEELEQKLELALTGTNDALKERQKILKQIKEDKTLEDDELVVDQESLQAELDNSEDRVDKWYDDQVDAKDDYWQKQNDIDDQNNQEQVQKDWEANQNIVQNRNLFGEQLIQQSENITNAIISNKRREVEGEINLIEARFESGKISREEADKQIRRLQTEQAEREKQLALLQATINLSLAVIKALAVDPTGVTSARIATIGAIELLAIQATEIPAFKEGVVDFKGKGSETSDENLVLISNRESVMTAEATKKYKDELIAMQTGNYEDFVDTKFQNNLIRELADIQVGVHQSDGQGKKIVEVLKDSKRDANINADMIVNSINKTADLKRSRRFL